MKTFPIPPTGSRPIEAFPEDDASQAEWREGTYPPSPAGDELAQARQALGYGLREAARLLGVSPGELSELEGGSRAFAEPSDWPVAIGKLRATKREQSAAPLGKLGHEFPDLAGGVRPGPRAGRQGRGRGRGDKGT